MNEIKRGRGRPRKELVSKVNAVNTPSKSPKEQMKQEIYKRMEKQSCSLPIWMTNPESVPVETPPPLPYKYRK